MSFFFRKMIRKLPGVVIKMVPKHEHIVTADYGSREKIGEYVRGKTVPVIAVPSTSGTGAEITVGAVVNNEKGIKISTVIIGLDVPHVVLDSELTIGAPESVTVYSGIDALSHGLEGIIADIHSTEEDIHKSLGCVKLVFEHLPKLISNPENIDARQNMSLAAYYGGNAINKAASGLCSCLCPFYR